MTVGTVGTLAGSLCAVALQSQSGVSGDSRFYAGAAVLAAVVAGYLAVRRSGADDETVRRAFGLAALTAVVAVAMYAALLLESAVAVHGAATQRHGIFSIQRHGIFAARHGGWTLLSVVALAVPATLAGVAFATFARQAAAAVLVNAASFLTVLASSPATFGGVLAAQPPVAYLLVSVASLAYLSVAVRGRHDGVGPDGTDAPRRASAVVLLFLAAVGTAYPLARFLDVAGLLAWRPGALTAIEVGVLVGLAWSVRRADSRRNR